MRKVDTDEFSVKKIIVVPPDGGWGWVVVCAAFLCILIMDGISNTFGLLIPIFQTEFNASVSKISLINSLFTGFYFIFAPVAGSLSNRFGFRPVIIAGSITSSIGLAISVFTDSVKVMFVTYGVIGGLGFSMMYINVVLTVGFYFERWRALATGITVSASGVGTFLFAPVVQILLKKYSWRHIFCGYSCLVFLCSIMAICFRPLPPVIIEDSDEGKKPNEIEKDIKPVQDAGYPSVSEALESNQFTSVESFELPHYSSKEFNSSRRPTEYSQFQSSHDLMVTASPMQLNPMKSSSKSHTPSICCRRKKITGVRPLYRDDIFYEGSVTQLPVYERNSSLVTNKTQSLPTPTNRSSLLYHLSVSRLPTHRDLEEEKDNKCHLFPESMTRALRTMFDFRLMKHPLFLLFTVSTCFLAIGVNVPSYFAYIRALQLNLMSERDAAMLLSAIGITNTVGRILCGIIGSLPRINIIMIHFGFLIFGAVLNMCVIFIYTKEALFAYASLYGFVIAEQGSLRSVTLVQLVGLERLTNAFGILLLFLGIFTVAGTPTAGYAEEITGSNDTVFLFSSVSLLLAALTLLPLLVGKLKVKIQQNSQTCNIKPNKKKQSSSPTKSQEDV